MAGPQGCGRATHGCDALAGHLGGVGLAEHLAVDLEHGVAADDEDALALGGRILFLDAEERALVEYPGERTVETLRAFMTTRMETRGGDAL